LRVGVTNHLCRPPSPSPSPSPQTKQPNTNTHAAAFNTYTLLLFSGAIDLDTSGRGLVVDGWLRLRGWARIGVLVSRLRGVIDQMIERRVENPATYGSSSSSSAAAAGEDTTGSEIIRLVTRLIELDGMDA
jgi:ATP-dependent RNA helicase DHX57